MNIKTNKYRALIVADQYGEPSYAPRLRSVCDYLTQHNWQIEVYTEVSPPLTFEHSYPIYQCKLYKNRSWDWAIKTFYSIFTDWKNRYFTRWILNKTQTKEYNIVFCTTFSTFPLKAALAVAQNKNIPLHVDLRDIDEQAPNSQYQQHRQWWARLFRKIYRDINIKRRNTVIRQAQQLTTISTWHTKFLSNLNPNTHLIYNGYDTNTFQPKNIPSTQFKIVYTGRIYEPELQDPTLLFQALQQLDKKIELRIVWYTNDIGKARITALAQQYHVEHLMEYHDYVPTNSIPHILQESSIVLVISHKVGKNGPHGIMTTKFFEALGVEKPVLCVPSDEECLAEVIQQTNAGIAAKTSKEVEQFILSKYHEWQQNGYTRQPVNQDIKQRFTRQYQARQFEDLFLSLI